LARASTAYLPRLQNTATEKDQCQAEIRTIFYTDYIRHQTIVPHYYILQLSNLDRLHDALVIRDRRRWRLIPRVLLLLPILVQANRTSRRASATSDMNVVVLCVMGRKLDVVVVTTTTMLQVSRSCGVGGRPARRLPARTVVRRHLAKDLAQKRPQCGSGGCG
jgi:hypothetical protein